MSGGTLDLHTTASVSSGEYVDLYLYGNFTWSGGTLKRTNSAATGPFTTIDFKKASGTQEYTQSGGTYSSAGRGITWSKSGGASVNNTYSGSTAMSAKGYLGGVNNFTVNSSSTITLYAATTVNGIFYMTQGTFALGGNTLTWGASASLNYNGSAAQTTSAEWPATFTRNVTINNSSTDGVSLNESKTYNSTGTITVNGYLKCAAYNITGTGAFTLASAGTLGIGSAAGISSTAATGNIQVTGTRTYSTGANYTYNGTSAQVTGNQLPATVNNLTINNSSGVALTSGTITSGTLILTSGTFSVGSNTLTLNGPTIAGTPANLSTTLSSNLSFGGSSIGVSIPSSVTALNNLTINNSNGVSLSSSPTVNGTLTLTSGLLDIGPNNLTLGSAATIGGTPSATKMIVATGNG